LVNRYYDPSTDQFLSVDPDVSETDQPYSFTDDDPLNATDPLGLKCGHGPCPKKKKKKSETRKSNSIPLFAAEVFDLKITLVVSLTVTGPATDLPVPTLSSDGSFSLNAPDLSADFSVEGDANAALNAHLPDGGGVGIGNGGLTFSVPGPSRTVGEYDLSTSLDFSVESSAPPTPPIDWDPILELAGAWSAGIACGAVAEELGPGAVAVGNACRSAIEGAGG
jgi:hypothetical protein